MAYAIHPDGKERSQVPEDLARCLESEYVSDYDADQKKLIYSEAFYPELDKKLSEGMRPREAYESFGLSVNVLGRDRANNACRKARKKALESSKGKAGTDGPGGHEEKEDEGLIEACKGNPYVRMITGGRIFYTEGFFTDLSAHLEAGLSPLKAYEALGFPIEKLGEQRAYKAAERAREWKRKQAEPHFSLGDYDGTVPLSEMIKEWGEPTYETQWEAFLMARVIAMEKREEALKKTR